jgi:Protein chain release factor A
MIPELESVEDKYRRLVQALADPSVLSDPKKFRDLSKERADIEPLVKKIEELKRVRADIAGSREILSDPRTDPDLKTLAEAELRRLEEADAVLAHDIRILLVPKDPLDERGVVLEIRAGRGVDESSLFAQDLCRMYARYAEKKAGFSRSWRRAFRPSADSRRRSPASAGREPIRASSSKAACTGFSAFPRLRPAGGSIRPP